MRTPFSIVSHSPISCPSSQSSFVPRGTPLLWRGRGRPLLHIAQNLLRLRKSLTCLFLVFIRPSISIRLISLIRPINFPTRPKRHCETATLGGSSGPNDNLRWALLKGHSGRKSPPLGGWGACWELFIKKRKRSRASLAHAKIHKSWPECKCRMKKADSFSEFPPWVAQT